MRLAQSTVLISALAVLSAASAQLSMDDPSPTGGVSGGDSSLGLNDPSGGLSDPYPYPTDSDSLGVPQATPTGAGSGAGPVESGGVGSGSGSGGHQGGAGGYSPVPKPAGLEFPVEACYPACTPLANDAETCHYYPIDMDIDSSCICNAAVQADFEACFDCQLQQAPMSGAVQYYQGLLDRLSEQCANDNSPVKLSPVVMSGSSGSGSTGSGSGSGSGSPAAGASGAAKSSTSGTGTARAASPSGSGSANGANGSGSTGNSGAGFKSNGAGRGTKTAGGFGGIVFVVGLILWSGAAI